MATFTIAWNDFRRTFRDRHNLFWIFVAPLMFAIFFGMMLRPSTSQPTSLAIVDEDGTTIARDLAAMLSADGIRTSVVQRTPARGFALVVPKGTGAALASDGAVKLVLKAGAEQTNEERRLQFKIEKALIDITLRGGAPSAVKASEAGPLSVTSASLDVSRQGRTFGFQYAIPAYIVMFVFMNLLVSGAGIAEERATGRLRRLAMAPITFREIVLGKLLLRVAVGWAQMGYLLLVGVLLFRIEWGGNPFTLFAFLSVLALAAGALGLVVGTTFRDPDKCASLAVWSVMILSPLGGLWWPIEIVGPTLRTVASIVPTGWAMQGVNSIMAFGAGPLEVAPFAGALAALFVVCMTVATHRLRRQMQAS